MNQLTHYFMLQKYTMLIEIMKQKIFWNTLLSPVIGNKDTIGVIIILLDEDKYDPDESNPKTI